MREFYKYEGCGNDYIYFDCLNMPFKNMSEAAIRLSDRHFGIGGDGAVFIYPSSKADAYMRMFNNDGSEGKMCGNAIRCVAKYLYDKCNVKKEFIDIETLSGIKRIQVFSENYALTHAKVDMGSPGLNPKDIPANIKGNNVICKKITVGGKEREITLVSMGNPHCVIFVDDVSTAEVEKEGKKIENDILFPEKINVEFVQKITPTHIKMRVWERGSGETLACGTGACAAAVACVLGGFSSKDSDITVDLLGGNLTINYGKTVYMTGAAKEVFRGVVDYYD